MPAQIAVANVSMRFPAVGAPTAGKRIDTFATAIWAGMTAAELQWVDLSYAPPMSGVMDPVLVAARAAVSAAAR